MRSDSLLVKDISSILSQMGHLVDIPISYENFPSGCQKTCTGIGRLLTFVAIHRPTDRMRDASTASVNLFPLNQGYMVVKFVVTIL